MAKSSKITQPSEAPWLPTRRLIGVKEVAKKLGVSRSTVYALFKNGELPFVKIGGRRLTEEADVDAYIEKLKKIAQNPHKDMSLEVPNERQAS